MFLKNPFVGERRWGLVILCKSRKMYIMSLIKEAQLKIQKINEQDGTLKITKCLHARQPCEKKSQILYAR